MSLESSLKVHTEHLTPPNGLPLEDYLVPVAFVYLAHLLFLQ